MRAQEYYPFGTHSRDDGTTMMPCVWHLHLQLRLYAAYSMDVVAFRPLHDCYAESADVPRLLDIPLSPTHYWSPPRSPSDATADGPQDGHD